MCNRLPLLAALLWCSQAGTAFFPAGAFNSRPDATRALFPPWQTCSLAEGKSLDCGPGDRPRVFREFLSPGDWTIANGSFSAEFQADIKRFPTFTVSWRELGRWGTHRIRTVTYSRGGSSFAKLILVEGSPNIFSPVMKWSGRMPQPALYNLGQVQVLVLQKDFGGNIPMVSTWAWVWGSRGAVRLDVDSAISEAIQKVAPGYKGYNTGLDWAKLHCRTGVWSGRYPGKVGVSAQVEAWFELAPDRLLVRRAVFSDGFGIDQRTVGWPSATSRLISEEALRTADPALIDKLVVRIRGVDGARVSSLRVRVSRTGVTASVNPQGLATIQISPPLQEGTPVLLEVVDATHPLVVISPCRGIVAVTRSTSDIFVAQRGRRDLLRDSSVLEALADCILRIGPPQERYAYSAYLRHRREALALVAASVQIRPAELDSGIRALSRTAAHPLRRGLVALYRQRPDQAEHHLRDALRHLETPTSSDRAPSLQSNELARASFYLARALYAQRRFVESVEVLKRSGRIWPFDSAALTLLGFALAEGGDFASAEIALRRSLSAEEAASGPDADTVATHLHHLAYAMYTNQDYRGIEECYRQAPSILARTRGADSIQYAEFLHYRAELAAEESDYATAESLFRKALAIRTKVLGSQHAETADTMLDLGTTRYHQHVCAGTEALFRSVLAIRRRLFGALHPATAAAWNAVAFCYDERGQNDMAGKYYRRALSIQLNTIGENRTATAIYMSNLGKVLVQPQQNGEAEVLLTRALVIRQSLLGPEHPSVIDDLFNLSWLYSRTGRLRESEHLMRRALAMREGMSGPEHPDVGSLLTNLSVILINQQRLSEAEPLLRRALRIQETTLGADHRDTGQSLANIGIVLDRQGRTKEAEPYFERALRIYTAVLGPEHPETRNLHELRKTPGK